MLVINIVVVSSSSSTCENYTHFSVINQLRKRVGRSRRRGTSMECEAYLFSGNSLNSNNIKVDFKIPETFFWLGNKSDNTMGVFKKLCSFILKYIQSYFEKV